MVHNRVGDGTDTMAFINVEVAFGSWPVDGRRVWIKDVGSLRPTKEGWSRYIQKGMSAPS